MTSHLMATKLERSETQMGGGAIAFISVLTAPALLTASAFQVRSGTVPLESRHK
jgi:hypothetical protein